MKTKDAYTELAIQIATLDMKVSKVLELLNKPEPLSIKPLKDIIPEDVEKARKLFADIMSDKEFGEEFK